MSSQVVDTTGDLSDSDADYQSAVANLVVHLEQGQVVDVRVASLAGASTTLGKLFQAHFSGRALLL